MIPQCDPSISGFARRRIFSPGASPRPEVGIPPAIDGPWHALYTILCIELATGQSVAALMEPIKYLPSHDC